MQEKWTTPNGTISIHAAQEGCDAKVWTGNDTSLSISIHAAQEGCDIRTAIHFNYSSLFQSTQPKRAATLFIESHLPYNRFQSTQPKRAAT